MEPGGRTQMVPDDSHDSGIHGRTSCGVFDYDRKRGRVGRDESADAVLSGRRAHARSGCESPGGDDYKKCQSRGMPRDCGSCIQWDGKG